MYNHLNGTCSTDPLFILLSQEDEAEADAYADTLGELNHQMNINAETWNQGFNFGDEPFSLDEGFDIGSSATDEAIDNLITYLEGKKK